MPHINPLTTESRHRNHTGVGINAVNVAANLLKLNRQIRQQINLGDEHINKSISEINDNRCRFEEYLQIGNPSIT